MRGTTSFPESSSMCLCKSQEGIVLMLFNYYHNILGICQICTSIAYAIWSLQRPDDN